MTRHRRLVHPVFVDGCYPCRLASIQVGPAATPTRSGASSGDYAFQADFAAEFHNGDREAYRRLRADGVQPRSIRGSAYLEAHAETRYEVESGVIEPDRKALRTALAVCDDHGFDPLTPSLTEKAG